MGENNLNWDYPIDGITQEHVITSYNVPISVLGMLPLDYIGYWLKLREMSLVGALKRDVIDDAFGTSRNTTKKILKELENAGLIRREIKKSPESGTVVGIVVLSAPNESLMDEEHRKEFVKDANFTVVAETSPTAQNLGCHIYNIYNNIGKVYDYYYYLYTHKQIDNINIINYSYISNNNNQKGARFFSQSSKIDKNDSFSVKKSSVKTKPLVNPKTTSRRNKWVKVKEKYYSLVDSIDCSTKVKKQMFRYVDYLIDKKVDLPEQTIIMNLELLNDVDGDTAEMYVDTVIKKGWTLIVNVKDSRGTIV